MNRAATRAGIISLMISAIAIPARYVFHLGGSWCCLYVIGATTALFLNVFVLVVQLLKVPALKALAPIQTEPLFLVAQSVVLFVYLGLTILATKRFHIEPA
jgi:hypothetical protein